MTPQAFSLVVPSAETGDDRVDVIDCEDAVVLVLADGAGGAGGGAQAAEAAVSMVRERSRELVTGVLHPTQLLVALDQQLAAGRSGGQTTAIVMVVRPSSLVGASVGDSEAWLLTADAALGLTQHQRRKPLLGTGAAIAVAFASSQPRGRLLVGSDGLFKYAKRDRILALVRVDALKSAPAQLVDLARLPNGALQDDVAVIVVTL